VELSLGKDNPREAPEEHFIRPGETKPEELNLLILGGGTGGTIAAWTTAQCGQRVAVIERKYISRSFANIACLPSKDVIHSAKVASYLRRSEEFGIAKRDVGYRFTHSNKGEIAWLNNHRAEVAPN
jgi:pyruvate/2-oxoglutarate dehydrogenase complex dihydrolipoamide dehydrogenase (E3) component